MATEGLRPVDASARFVCTFGRCNRPATALCDNCGNARCAGHGREPTDEPCCNSALAAPPSPSAAQPSQDVAGTSGESLAGLSKEGSET